MTICDTDVMVDVLRGHPLAIECLKSIPKETIALPGIVMMELIQGCRTKTEQQKLQKFLKEYPLLWPSNTACEHAYRHFTSHYLSQGIGIMDALIAEIAAEAGVPLHTFNQKHYQTHPRLKTVQPYKK